MRLFRSPRAGAAVATIALLIAYFVAGPSGLAGMALGLSGTGISLLLWWLIIRMMGRNLPEEGKVKPIDGTNWVVVAFLLKLPILFALAFLARHIGGAAVSGFLWGLGLVYLALVGWALSRDDGTP